MGILSSNELTLFKMKQIYICDIYEDKIQFLEGDHRTSVSTFYYDEDIKSKCFKILTNLNKIDNCVDYVNIYHHNNIIYIINKGNNNCEYSFSNKIIRTNYGYALK